MLARSEVGPEDWCAEPSRGRGGVAEQLPMTKGQSPLDSVAAITSRLCVIETRTVAAEKAVLRQRQRLQDSLARADAAEERLAEIEKLLRRALAYASEDATRLAKAERPTKEAEALAREAHDRAQAAKELASKAEATRVYIEECAARAYEHAAASMRPFAPPDHDPAHSGTACCVPQLEDLPPSVQASPYKQNAPKPLAGVPGTSAATPAGVSPSTPPANDHILTSHGSSRVAPSIRATARVAQHQRSVEDALFGVNGPDDTGQADLEEPLDPREATRRKAIITAFRADRLELHLQPIVTLPQRNTCFYEALGRLRLEEEALLEPIDFLPVLEDAGLAPELDGKIAARAAAVARHLINHGSDAFVTCNLSLASVRKPGFLRALGRIFDAYPEIPGQFAFEIAQRSWRTLDAETAGALENLRARGAFFVLDRAEDMHLDPLTLADRGVAYAKLPASMLLDPRPSNGLDFEPADLAAVLARTGIKLVAENVEQDRCTTELLDLKISLAQGFAFAMPRAVRADILGGERAPDRQPHASAARASTAGGIDKDSGHAAATTDPAATGIECRSNDLAQSDSETPQEPRPPHRDFLRRVV